MKLGRQARGGGDRPGHMAEESWRELSGLFDLRGPCALGTWGGVKEWGEGWGVRAAGHVRACGDLKRFTDQQLRGLGSGLTVNMTCSQKLGSEAPRGRIRGHRPGPPRAA